MRTDELPSSIWTALGIDPDEVTGIAKSALAGGTGAASGQVELITLTLGPAPVRRLVRKSFRWSAAGRHAANSRKINHWAHWRRELIAYGSRLLPNGSDLRARAAGRRQGRALL